MNPHSLQSICGSRHKQVNIYRNLFNEPQKSKGCPTLSRTSRAPKTVAMFIGNCGKTPELTGPDLRSRNSSDLNPVDYKVGE